MYVMWYCHCDSIVIWYILHWHHLLSLAPSPLHWLLAFWKKAKLSITSARSKFVCMQHLIYVVRTLKCFLKLHHATTYKDSYVFKWVQNLCFCTFWMNNSSLIALDCPIFTIMRYMLNFFFKPNHPVKLIMKIKTVAIAHLLMHVKNELAHVINGHL